MPTPVDPGKTNKFVTAIAIVYFQRYPGTEASSGIANVAYTLWVDGVIEHTGKTDAHGSIILNLPTKKTAVLEIFGSRYEIQLREHLEALNTLKGEQRRLSMLGYNLGDVDGVLGVRTDNAILNFQADNSLDTDGIIGPKTSTALKKQAGE